MSGRAGRFSGAISAGHDPRDHPEMGPVQPRHEHVASARPGWARTVSRGTPRSFDHAPLPRFLAQRESPPVPPSGPRRGRSHLPPVGPKTPTGHLGSATGRSCVASVGTATFPPDLERGPAWLPTAKTPRPRKARRLRRCSAVRGLHRITASARCCPGTRPHRGGTRSGFFTPAVPGEDPPASRPFPLARVPRETADPQRKPTPEDAVAPPSARPSRTSGPSPKAPPRPDHGSAAGTTPVPNSSPVIHRPGSHPATRRRLPCSNHPH